MNENNLENNLENQDSAINHANIHTLESDLAAAVTSKDYGRNIIKIVTDPNSRAKKDDTVYQDRFDKTQTSFLGKKNIFLLIIILIFFSGASAVLYILNKATQPIEENTVDIASTTENNASTTVKPLVIQANFLNPEILQESDFRNNTREEIVFEVGEIKKSLLNKGIKPDNIVGINTGLNTQDFFQKLRYSGDGGLIRSLKDSYAFGLYHNSNSEFETYIIIEVQDFDLAFKSMLLWEKFMSVDLKDIFVTDVIQKNIDQNSTSTDILYKKKNSNVFTDRIFKNNDIREYNNNEYSMNIVYGFINNKFLIITSGESSFIDIKDRLLKQNIIR